MRWRRLLAGVAATVALLAGCSGGGKASITTGPRASIQTNDSSAVAAARTPTSDELKGRLLTVSDLPAGSAVDSSEPDNTSCVNDALGRIPGRAAKEQASFAMDPSDGPFLKEQAVTYRDADAAFDAIPDAMAKCGHFTQDEHGVHYEITVAPMSFAAIGGRSVAYRIDVDASKSGIEVTGSAYVVYFERHGAIGVVIYTGSSVDLEAFTPLTMKAASKF